MLDRPAAPRLEAATSDAATSDAAGRDAAGRPARRAPRARRAAVLLTLGPALVAACAEPPERGPRGADGVADGGGEAPRRPDAAAPPGTPRAPDTDGDALLDREEVALGSDPEAVDSDGDGWLDGIEVAAGSDPTRGDARPGPGSVQLVLPADGGGLAHRVPFRLRVDDADVVFLVDGTASMGPAIDAVRASLGDRIVPGLARALDRPRLALGVVRDFPRSGHGDDGDAPLVWASLLDHDPGVLRDALGTVDARGGGDVPEALVEAVGRAADGACRRPPDPEAPGRRRFGEACFAADRTPIVVLLSDAPSHNGVDAAHDYGFAARRLEPTLAALAGWGVRVAGVAVHPRARPDLSALAEGSGAVDRGGAPMVVDAPEGRVGEAVVDAVRGLAGAFSADVRLVLGTGPGVGWVRRVEATHAAPPGDGTAGAVFRGLPAGAEGAFTVTLAAPGADPARGRVASVDVTVESRRHAAPLARARLLLWAPPTRAPLR